MTDEGATVAEILIVEGGTTLFGVVPGQIVEVVASPDIRRGAEGAAFIRFGGEVPFCTLAGLAGDSLARVDRAIVARGPSGLLAYGASAIREVRPLPRGAVRPLPALLRESLAGRGLLGLAFLPEGTVLLADLAVLHPAARGRR